MSRTSKSKQKIFHCYALCDPTKPGIYYHGPRTKLYFEPFYIGYGHGKRSSYHAKQALRIKGGVYVDNSMKSRKIRKIINSGNEVIIVKTKTLVCQKDAQVREIELIKLIGRRDLKKGPLANLTDGGEGTAGVIPSKATIQKRKEGVSKFFDSLTLDELLQFKSNHGKSISKSKKGVPNKKSGIAQKGKIVPEATRMKMSLAQMGNSNRKGKLASTETRLNMSIARKGMRWSDEQKLAQSIRLKGKSRPNAQGKPWSEARRAAQNARRK